MTLFNTQLTTQLKIIKQVSVFHIKGRSIHQSTTRIRYQNNQHQYHHDNHPRQNSVFGLKQHHQHKQHSQTNYKETVTSRSFTTSPTLKMPFAKINGKQLHYTDYPSSSPSHSSKTIILIHGLGSTQNYYTPILPHLLPNHRCITFDNYGAGRSTYLPDQYPETSIPSIAKDVIGLLDFLAVDKVVVVGYSMGGMLPSYLAGDEEEFRGRVVGGVCIGPVNPSETVAEVFRKRVPVVRDGGIETMANTIPTSATGPNTTPLQKAFIREMLLSQSPQGYIANCHAIETATPPTYSQVKCPMLIIAGEVDKSAPLEGCRFIFEQLGTGTANKKMEVLDGVGHWHCVEDSERVGRLVKGFVDSL